MVWAIDEALPGYNVVIRRFLLTIKRSCFNSREIKSYRKKVEWGELRQVSPDLAERIVTLEEQIFENDRAFSALYEHELTRERRHILELIKDRRFLRGVAVGRPGLVQKIRTHAPSLTATGFGKAPAKWEQSLLRFVTRAAAKLSANSTLTTYALGSIQAFSSRVGFRVIDSPQREISLVRADRPELEQLQALLMRHPAVRERALLAWNDSVEELGSGKYRFLRGGHWNLAAGAEVFHFVRPARITVELSNGLLGAAREALSEGELRCDELLAVLREQRLGISTDEGMIELANQRALDQLIDLGVLILMPPWPAHEPRLEERIGQFLRTLSNEPSLRATTDAMDELLALEEGFSSALRPERSVARMEEVFSRLLDTIAHLAGHDGSLATRAKFYEDVLFEPAVNPDQGRILQVPESTIREILHSASLVTRFAGLFNHRHDVLHTLAAWWREHEPSRRDIPFTQVAQGFAPLWKQFLHFHRTANQSALNTFDPLRTDSLATLREMRESLLSRYKELLSSLPAKDVLPPQQLEDLLESLPCRYASMLGSCVFVQPADAEGSSWVLNQLHEGTGRYLSRVTPVLEDPLRQRLLNHLTARSVVSLDGEEADLLEVMHPWGNLVNAHPPQAAKVLDVPGQYLGLPEERRVNLGDLSIHADLESETFRLIDPSGRRVLPANLSTLADVWHPNLLRFLLAFGPGETRGVFPHPHSEGDNELRSFSRLTCGKLVLRRRHWMIDIQSLRDTLGNRSEARAYSYINDWRRHLNLPSVCFYLERTFYGANKPQYLDFSSPSLCGLFVSSLRRMGAGHLTLEEALPLPVSDFPLDATMDRRGFELLIDSLAVRTEGGNPSAGVTNRDRESKSLRKDQ